MSESPKTKREALEQSLRLWEHMAKNPHVAVGAKPHAAFEVLGYRPQIACPACEYAILGRDEDSSGCRSCPVDGWGAITPCLSLEYGDWAEAQRNGERRKAARAIVKRLRRSIKNLGDDDEN